MQAQQLIIYHGDCTDGFCAAWAARRAQPSAEFFAASHGQPPPDVTGRIVTIVDFSYPRKTLIRMAEEAYSIRVLDHHKTAQADLAEMPWCVFDMDRSGAGLAWDYLQSESRPWIVDYVEDRDLWRWALSDSREINAAIMSWPREFEFWDNQLSWGDTARKAAIAEGVAILRFTDHCVEECCRRARLVRFPVPDPKTGGVQFWRIPVVNVFGKFISETVGRLCEGYPFAVGWSQAADGRFVYSLRSRGDFDVSEIAKLFGGGGHKNAAGFVSDQLLAAIIV